MTNHTAAPPLAFLGGNPSLDFVNTVAWTRDGLARERLITYDALTQWAQHAGIIADSIGASLRSRAKHRPKEAAEALTRAREIRAICQRLFAPGSTAKAWEISLSQYNAQLREALRGLEIGPAEGHTSKGVPDRMRWWWPEIGDRLDSLLQPVLWSAATLLVSDEFTCIRMCGGEDCGWLFVDRSRNGLRRWCRMETCGNQAKSRRRRERSCAAS